GQWSRRAGRWRTPPGPCGRGGWKGAPATVAKRTGAWRPRGPKRWTPPPAVPASTRIDPGNRTAPGASRPPGLPGDRRPPGAGEAVAAREPPEGSPVPARRGAARAGVAPRRQVGRPRASAGRPRPGSGTDAPPAGEGLKAKPAGPSGVPRAFGNDRGAASP